MLRNVAGRVLPYLPDRVVAAALKRRPYWIDALPRSFVWPYHAGSISVWVNPQNAIERYMLTPHYDADVQQAITKHVRPGQIAMDVGANVGAVTLMLAQAVGSSGRVIAIEPGPPYRDRLNQNLALNPKLAPCVTVEAIGISDRPGSLTWEADPDAPFNAVLSAGGSWFKTGRGVTVPIDTIDSLVSRLALPRVDFIKVDVESMELEVLRGAAETLRALRPVVLLETMAWARDHRLTRDKIDIFTAIPAYLDAMGYDTRTRDDCPVDWSRPPDNSVAVPR